MRRGLLKGGRQMRSISIMPSDDMAGDAVRRVPIPIERRSLWDRL